ncbi:MAG TPA: PIN domain-containing protein [Terriglobia bacterium]|nr:PIN domain-containing protein [Terriglobia bacterium]
MLIDALTGPRRSASGLRDLLAGPEPVTISTIVLFEWLRGPRISQETDAQEALFPAADSAPFGFFEARIASHLYKTVRKARGREADLAIAACAQAADASLWTLNEKDFADIPNLKLWRPGSEA